MSDDIDRAQAREEAMRQEALRAHERRAYLDGRYALATAMTCAVCDDPIPAARRQALPGVQTCIDCQIDLEKTLQNIGL